MRPFSKSHSERCSTSSSTLVGRLLAMFSTANSLQNNNLQQTEMLPVSITRKTIIAAPRNQVFGFIVAEDVLPKVLTGFGPLPAVIGTSEQSGPWDQPGATRLVHLGDGSTVREKVEAFNRPDYFSYRTWEFTNPIIRRLAFGARGEWQFKDVKDTTDIEWTYTFYAKSKLALPALYFVITVFWRGYMDVCLMNARRQIMPC